MVEDGQATINLGSVDGLAKGSEVEVYRDNTLKHPAGTLRVGTLFREQARADVGPKDLKVKYVVQVTDGDHLQALIQQATASEARGDLTEARRAAASANKWANNATVTTSQKASAAELLARLDFTAKDLAGAEMHYRAALDFLSADQHVSQNDLAEVQNDLAALAMLRAITTPRINYFVETRRFPRNPIYAPNASTILECWQKPVAIVRRRNLFILRRWQSSPGLAQRKKGRGS